MFDLANMIICQRPKGILGMYLLSLGSESSERLKHKRLDLDVGMETLLPFLQKPQIEQ